MWLKIGVKKDGSITAIDFKAWADGGAYASYGVVTSYYLGVFMPLPYRLENYRFESHRLYTNKPPCGPKRGHGAIQPRFALELHMDKAARLPLCSISANHRGRFAVLFTHQRTKHLAGITKQDVAIRVGCEWFMGEARRVLSRLAEHRAGAGNDLPGLGQFHL